MPGCQRVAGSSLTTTGVTVYGSTGTAPYIDYSGSCHPGELINCGRFSSRLSSIQNTSSSNVIRITPPAPSIKISSKEIIIAAWSHEISDIAERESTLQQDANVTQSLYRDENKLGAMLLSCKIIDICTREVHSRRDSLRYGGDYYLKRAANEGFGRDGSCSLYNEIMRKAIRAFSCSEEDLKKLCFRTIELYFMSLKANQVYSPGSSVESTAKSFFLDCISKNGISQSIVFECAKHCAEEYSKAINNK
ncbi:hypothetical protein [Enterobacter mori]|uniref:hypothetical protein n=1 Tax=Enterobacter mori TaxID=539813 RepID=UPI001B8BD1EB|nr:hypothetical protein [Enterobacter mori]MBS3050399.1 hypothetical protein [Enterobacter mori]